MNIELVSIESIKPYDKNPRVHGDVQIKRIAKSIKDFGWTQPLVVDDTNTILAGHGRYAAALQLGIAEVPVVNVKHLSEAQKKAYRIIDNKLVTDSIWDDDLLQQELNDLVDLDFALNDFGLDNFIAETPEDGGEAQDLEGVDQPKLTKCPACGHEWEK